MGRIRGCLLCVDYVWGVNFMNFVDSENFMKHELQKVLDSGWKPTILVFLKVYKGILEYIRVKFVMGKNLGRIEV